MRIGTKGVATAIGLGVPRSLSMVAPAAADDPVLRTSTWSGQYEGRPLTCDVEASSDVDLDDLDPPRALVYDRHGDGRHGRLLRVERRGGTGHRSTPVRPFSGSPGS